MSAADVQKRLDGRRRMALDEQVTHIRAGWWWGEPTIAVTVIGTAVELHGTVCSCCARRAA